jgi:hypothetical protein
MGLMTADVTLPCSSSMTLALRRLRVFWARSQDILVVTRLGDKHAGATILGGNHAPVRISRQHICELDDPQYSSFIVCYFDPTPSAIGAFTRSQAVNQQFARAFGRSVDSNF